MHGFSSLGSRSGRPDAEEQETDIQKIKENYIWKVCVLGLFISYRDSNIIKRFVLKFYHIKY